MSPAEVDQVGGHEPPEFAVFQGCAFVPAPDSGWIATERERGAANPDGDHY
jgi:hypothetical protein